MARRRPPKPPHLSDFLPTTPEEVTARNWPEVDVVFVTGDAYVDHPSFAMALLGRLLQSEGYRVAILSQPDWHSPAAWQTFGRPRLCFAISAGNMDSMINHYTANRKVRNRDAYSPGGQIRRRPDRATLAYCQRARQAYQGVPVIAGGVEASLRRLAHYDYWSDKVRRSLLLDAKADLFVYGMGERALVDIVRRLDAGQSVAQLRDLRGIAYRLGASETPPTENVLALPGYEEVVADRRAFAEMTRLVHRQTDPHTALTLLQPHGPETVVVNPPSLPLSEAEIDRVYSLPFTRLPHPSYGDRQIPAYEVVKDSIQIARGCFGGCTFCSITAHEGRIIQSRSQESILAEIRRIAQNPRFSGTISDLGGPTANMYRMNCSRPEVRTKCRRLSCIHPKVCKLLTTDHGPLIRLMKAARKVPGVKRVFIASGIRTDLAQRSTAYMSHLVRHHVGGHLKVAPEHAHLGVLRLMRKPQIHDFDRFARQFKKLSSAAGKEQYLVPYFLAGHPGSDLAAMIDLALYLKRTGYRPQQVQDFIPGPFDLATAMYHTGLDPMTGQEVHVPKGARQRRQQRALLQFFLPENYQEVRQALLQAGRPDLIGPGTDCLIPAKPPGQAAGRRQPPRGGDKPAQSRPGYRPHGKTTRRRN